MTTPRRASCGLYDTMDVVKKNFSVALGFVSFFLQIGVIEKLNNFKYFYIFLHVFASSVKGRPINQNSKTNPLN